MKKKYDVFGIGQPLVDYLIEVDDAFLQKNGFKKGDMQLVNSDLTSVVLGKFDKNKIIIDGGGSCGNTIYSIAQLGGKVAYLGSVGSGKLATFYEESFKAYHVKLCLPKHQNIRTGHSVSLITPDSERTMLTCLGASHNLQLEHLIEDDVKHSKILHLEAYMFEIPHLRKVVDYAISIAKANNVLVSVDLSSADLINRNYDDFQRFISESADIVFANEEEAEAFTGYKNPRKALDYIIEKCKIAVVKIGKKGSLITSKEEFVHIPTKPINIKDTTGAGDMFAAGFLYGITQGKSLKESGEIATRYAGKVCEQIGARLK